MDEHSQACKIDPFLSNTSYFPSERPCPPYVPGTPMPCRRMRTRETTSAEDAAPIREIRDYERGEGPTKALLP